MPEFGKDLNSYLGCMKTWDPLRPLNSCLLNAVVLSECDSKVSWSLGHVSGQVPGFPVNILRPFQAAGAGELGSVGPCSPEPRMHFVCDDKNYEMQTSVTRHRVLLGHSHALGI